ncbi:MAG TPA: tetratricopeptide repeat protein, partial [Bryobacteraceae bacterium]|nr:tetratricopeptide repeat protein [Bryobacteraceae bacterium]
VYQYPTPYHDAQNGPPNYLFRNRATAGGLIFDDVTRESGIDENNNRFSFAAAWCDFDGDGRPDLYVSNMWTAPGQRVVRDPGFLPAAGNEDAYRRHTKGNSLYRNKGDGTFEETGSREGVEMGRWAWSSIGFDWDLDGSPEIFIAAGMVTNQTGPERAGSDLESFFWRQVVAKSPSTSTPRTEYENAWNAIAQLFRGPCNWNGGEPNVFYARREGRYADVSGVSGLDFADDSRAFAVTDFDGDGYPDIVLKSRLGPQVRALQNECAAGRPVIVLKLRGTKSNSDAIGARVIVNGQMRDVTGGSGFLSQHSRLLHFGLGGRARADAIVLWPSGLRQEINGLEPGYTWTIVEGAENPTRVPLRERITYAGESPVRGINNADFGDTWLLDPLPDPGQHSGPCIVLLYAGERPAEASAQDVRALNLSREPAELAAAYALFRRYLFEYRTGLELPLALLVDSESRVRRVYGELPSEKVMRADLDTLAQKSPAQIRSLALPFGGRYFTEPARNYFKLGAAFYQAGYPRRALAYLEETLRSTPDNWRALLAVGEIHRELGEPDAALQSLRRALEIQPNHAPTMVSVGIVLLAKGDGTGARAMFTRAIAADSLCADAANQLGLLSIRSGDMDDARQWFQRAIEAQPNHSGALNNLGVLFAQKGQYADSIAVFRFGLERIPENEALYLNLARVYSMAGQRDSSIAVVNQLLE